MALAFLLIGAALIVAAFRNTEGDLFKLLSNDATGFAKWGIAIVAVGLLGFIPNFQTAGRLLLVLVLLVIVIANKGAFANFSSAVSQGPSTAAVPTEPSLAGTPTVDVALTGGSTGASTVGAAVQAIPFIGAAL